MQSADDVEFQRAFAHTLFGARVNFFQGKVIRAGRVGIAAESAQFAMRHAHVCGIDVPVDVEVRNVAVLFFTHVIRQPPDRQQIGRAVKRDALAHGEPFACQNFFRNRLQPLVSDREFAHFESVESFKRAKPLPPRPRTTETTY
jgi:hypothetical protein